MVNRVEEAFAVTLEGGEDGGRTCRLTRNTVRAIVNAFYFDGQEGVQSGSRQS